MFLYQHMMHRTQLKLFIQILAALFLFFTLVNGVLLRLTL